MAEGKWLRAKLRWDLVEGGPDWSPNRKSGDGFYLFCKEEGFIPRHPEGLQTGLASLNGYPIT